MLAADDSGLGAAFLHAVARTQADNVLRAADAFPTPPEQWRRALTFNDYMLTLTAALVVLAQNGTYVIAQLASGLLIDRIGPARISVSCDLVGAVALSRIRMLGLLPSEGPATATMLARRLGINTGATSYHLRQLAEYRFVTEDAGRGNHRERWWRTAHENTALTDRSRAIRPDSRRNLPSYRARLQQDSRRLPDRIHHRGRSAIRCERRLPG